MGERQDFVVNFPLTNNDTAQTECTYFVSRLIYVYLQINPPNYFTQDDKNWSGIFSVINLEYKKHKMWV